MKAVILFNQKIPERPFFLLAENHENKDGLLEKARLQSTLTSRPIRPDENRSDFVSVEVDIDAEDEQRARHINVVLQDNRKIQEQINAALQGFAYAILLNEKRKHVKVY